jgi:hypothetical protein
MFHILHDFWESLAMTGGQPTTKLHFYEEKKNFI